MAEIPRFLYFRYCSVHKFCAILLSCLVLSLSARPHLGLEQCS